jgi:endonuclease YncB( thermonuclease family)
MPWPWSSKPISPSPSQPTNLSSVLQPADLKKPQPTDKPTPSLPSLSQYLDPSTALPIALGTVILTASLLGTYTLTTRYLTRLPTVDAIPPTYYRTRSLFGTVTSVGDGDNFRLFHTPGGRLAGWSWLRSVPSARSALTNQTIHIRLAGVDAPEAAHFGKPAQPYSGEALEWLRRYILGRRVRVQLWRRDQYGRVVATVWVRRWWPTLKVGRVDVGKEMLRVGMAGVYEAKGGAEFGGREGVYRGVEERAKARGVGMWKEGVGVETPGEFKKRVGVGKEIIEEKGKGEEKKKKGWFW